MPSPLKVPSLEYAAIPRSTAGHIAIPVEFCRIPRNMYWFNTSNVPVRVKAPGFGSTLGASCAHAGLLARIKVVHAAAASIRAWLLTLDIESIHSSAIHNLRVEKAAASPRCRRSYY